MFFVPAGSCSKINEVCTRFYGETEFSFGKCQARKISVSYASLSQGLHQHSTTKTRISTGDWSSVVNQGGIEGGQTQTEHSWSLLVWKGFPPCSCTALFSTGHSSSCSSCSVTGYFPTHPPQGSSSHSTQMSNFSAVANSLHLSRCLHTVYRTPVSSFGSPSPLPPNYKIVDCCSYGLFFFFPFFFFYFFLSWCTKCQIAEIKNVNDGV